MTDFIKDDDAKPDLSLFPPVALLELGNVLDYGAKKYDRDNWRKVDDPNRYVAAALRHILAYMRGEKNDPETGLQHLAHAACSCLFLAELDLTRVPTLTGPVDHVTVNSGMVLVGACPACSQLVVPDLTCEICHGLGQIY